MPRSDHQFPFYRRLMIQIDLPPEGWDIGARRCMDCDRLWPNHDAFKTSPCCNYETNRCRRVLDLTRPGAMKDAIPQMTWAQAVHSLLMWRFELLYQVWNEALNDPELYFYATEEVDEAQVALELLDMDLLLAAN